MAPDGEHFESSLKYEPEENVTREHSSLVAKYRF